MTNIVWKTEKRRLGDLLPWVRNPRTIDRKQSKRLLESVEEFGQVETLAIGPENEIYNGHQRLGVLMDAHGADYEVDVRVSNRALTEQEREKLTVYLHRGTVGEWDFSVLAQEFELGNLLNWGFDRKDLDLKLWDVRNDVEDKGAEISRQDELQSIYGVELGDVWVLGNHRLACGDCTDHGIVEGLMNGNMARCLWTDPPYGVDYEGKTSDALKIENDKKELIESLLMGAFGLADEILVNGSPVYICHPPGDISLVFGECVLKVGWHFHETLVWVKDSMVLGHSDYHYKHEPIIYGWKGANRFWYAGRDRVSTFEIPRPKASRDFPIVKPVALVEGHLVNSTKAGDIVYDPFSGSGTTIIASERLMRVCYAVEKSPGYCAVALDRWAKTTGRDPIKTRNMKLEAR